MPISVCDGSTFPLVADRNSLGPFGGRPFSFKSSRLCPSVAPRRQQLIHAGCNAATSTTPVEEETAADIPTPGQPVDAGGSSGSDDAIKPDPDTAESTMQPDAAPVSDVTTSDHDPVTEAHPPMTAPNTARIRELNDALRTSTDPILRMVINGQLVVTSGIAQRGDDFFKAAVAAVRDFKDWSEDNDPWHEHDMAFLEVDGVRIFFKVDYYDPELEHLSDDPSNPEITRRVLTIGLASDY